MYLYEIQFKYLDALDEPSHTAQVVVYETDTIGGDKFQLAMDSANESGDYSEVNKLLEPLEVTDNDVCFYFDINSVGDELTKWGKLVPELQESFAIHISDIDLILEV